MRVLSRFVMAVNDARQFPAPALPEVAFLGRSNVGKSSVINSLLGHKVARTSSTPGRTRSINFFEVRWPGKPTPELMFTDLPGYGYARVPQEILQQWPSFIEPYLTQRPNLALCLCLIDVNVPPQQSDRTLIDFLRATGRAFVIIGTKSDRLSGNQLHKALHAFQQEFPHVRIVPYSARSGAGRNEVWQEIRSAVQSRQVLP